MALDTEVLLLDDLGAHRVTDWVEDTVTSIVTYRCNNRKALIATTNLPDADAGSSTIDRSSATGKPEYRSYAGRAYRSAGPLASIRDVHGDSHAAGRGLPPAKGAHVLKRLLALLLLGSATACGRHAAPPSTCRPLSSPITSIRERSGSANWFG